MRLNFGGYQKKSIGKRYDSNLLENVVITNSVPKSKFQKKNKTKQKQSKHWPLQRFKVGLGAMKEEEFSADR